MKYLYVLVDPRDDTIRWVGQTSNPTRRKSHHVICHESETNVKKNVWITELGALGLRPMFQVLAQLTDEDGRSTERRLLVCLRLKGVALLNLTDEEVSEVYTRTNHWRTASPEIRQQHADAIRQAWTPERRASQVRRLLNRPADERRRVSESLRAAWALRKQRKEG